MPSTIVIIGSTGAQGGGVARAVVADKSFDNVKLATRNVQSDSIKAQLKSLPGTTSVKIDLNDAASVLKAFEGADAVFATFNYWGTLASVGYDEAKAVATEYQQGVNVVDAAKDVGVKHLVLSTLEDVETITGGKLSAMHFTVKGRIETYAKHANVPYTFVRYAFYAQNFGTSFQPDDQGNFHLAMKDHNLDVVDTEDAGKAIAAIFREGPGVWSGKEIGLASDSMPVQKYLDIINEVKADGVERKYVAVPWEEMVKDPNTKDLGEMFAFYTDYDTQCIRDVEATKKLYPGLRNFRQYAEAAAAAGKL
jgi:uncharacterized protein YbjT (DUF2867 family)